MATTQNNQLTSDLMIHHHHHHRFACLQKIYDIYVFTFFLPGVIKATSETFIKVSKIFFPLFFYYLLKFKLHTTNATNNFLMNWQFYISYNS